jgi:hypothetical protein
VLRTGRERRATVCDRGGPPQTNTLAASTYMVASFKDIQDAFEFVSFGSEFEHNAFICKHTGKVYCQSEVEDIDEELPVNLDDERKYIAIPHKNDLDLGKRLALAFTSQFLENDFEKVQDIFRRKGAYSRFKDILERSGLLAQWYEFEAKAQEKALREWCEVNSIEISG